MDFLILLIKTVLLRPYVFIFLAVFLVISPRLLGWPRTAALFLLTWVTAFICEFSSTRTGVPFGWYHYTGSTKGQELYITNVPFMDSLSFPFLLFASYCVALAFLLPRAADQNGQRSAARFRLDPGSRRSWPVLALTVLLFVLLDVVIDPIALRGGRWFLGQIYFYPNPGIHFGVPLANYLGWGVVGAISVTAYSYCDGRLSPSSIPSRSGVPGGSVECGGLDVTTWILLGCGLYYGVLIFNLTVTFWIGEFLIGLSGVLLYLPITVLLALRLAGYPRASRGEATMTRSTT